MIQHILTGKVSRSSPFRPVHPIFRVPNTHGGALPFSQSPDYYRCHTFLELRLNVYRCCGNIVYFQLGITVKGKPKPMILKELGIETQAIYKEKLADGGGGIKQVLGQEKEEDDPFSWEGFVEIDTLLYPTMKGTIDIDQKGTVYDILASLHLPMGEAELRNEFDFIVRFHSITFFIIKIIRESILEFLQD